MTFNDECTDKRVLVQESVERLTLRIHLARARGLGASVLEGEPALPELTSTPESAASEPRATEAWPETPATE